MAMKTRAELSEQAWPTGMLLDPELTRQGLIGLAVERGAVELPLRGGLMSRWSRPVRATSLPPTGGSTSRRTSHIVRCEAQNLGQGQACVIVATGRDDQEAVLTLGIQLEGDLPYLLAKVEPRAEPRSAASIPVAHCREKNCQAMASRTT